jgi:hypothetical protein
VHGSILAEDRPHFWRESDTASRAKTCWSSSPASAEFENVGEAFFWEKRIQNWSRAKREALIRHDFEALPGLAKEDFTKRRMREVRDYSE